jgi:hypothetical protein
MRRKDARRWVGEHPFLACEYCETDRRCRVLLGPLGAPLRRLLIGRLLAGVQVALDALAVCVHG